MSGILPAFPNSRWAYSNLFFARMTPQEVAQQFVIAINAHDVECLATLMTSDHRFIDSLGTVVEGRDAMREGASRCGPRWSDCGVAGVRR